jgi:hypothetical protein
VRTDDKASTSGISRNRLSSRYDVKAKVVVSKVSVIATKAHSQIDLMKDRNPQTMASEQNQGAVRRIQPAKSYTQWATR